MNAIGHWRQYAYALYNQRMIELASTTDRDRKPEHVLKLPANKPLYLAHAYSVTVHSMQGLTNDWAMISLIKSCTASLNLFPSVRPFSMPKGCGLCFRMESERNRQLEHPARVHTTH